MPGPVEHRSVTPLVNFIRDICRGNKIILPHRYADDQSKRTQPPPNIPGGPYHKTSQIYYYTRDARREVKPPVLIGGIKQIDSGKASVAEKKFITPGKTYNGSS
ncbi:PREDICTED: NADH dehydrogenase [ubiquinone] 1 alpha subcomplex subunit 7-like [Trachymyrmex cornetzi]|uniref:NADH dehydrogenase [ubiquinone] 1 alpha subcomplex subunit 7 n=1 Tax=Trachymyrmex cornetzi TaxID=471704 RepID=A0A151ITD4_9HYME|nr:PREDICTED: NADH dehydrogenase [ubiquinone] 1 alpha subcomplex subunit 7-like [Trachymyrmex cornetzi]KYN10161.1 NADH dehydrogenase [ubiquinone] 1 alpha subcomplex subunit 7 [Trachymyrmex cornetzi]